MKKILVFVLVLFVVAVLINNCMFGTFGLSFYQGGVDDIKDVYACHDQIYILTNNDEVYVSGGHTFSKNNSYINNQLYYNDELSVTRPALIFKGKVKEIIPCYGLKALIITEDNVLYSFDDFNLTRVAPNVLCADQDVLNSHVYYTDTSFDLHIVSGGTDRVIASDINAVDCVGDDSAIYCITNNHQLLEGRRDDKGVFSFVTILDNVVKAKAEITNERISDGKNIYPSNRDEPHLINALTSDGQLLVKGVYNRYYNISSISSTNSDDYLRIYNDWTLISDNVQDFSLVKFGTSYILEDGSGCYFGFDTNFEKLNDFGTATITPNCVDVQGSSYYLIFKTSEEWLFFGKGFSLTRSVKCDIFSETPFIW